MLSCKIYIFIFDHQVSGCFVYLTFPLAIFCFQLQGLVKDAFKGKLLANVRYKIKSEFIEFNFNIELQIFKYLTDKHRQ